MKREQLESTFAAILRELFVATEGARSVSFVDDEGECVDFYGLEDPEQIRLWGAHMQSMLGNMHYTPLTTWHFISVRTEDVHLEALPVGEGHLLLLVKNRNARRRREGHLLEKTACALRVEAGLSPPGHL